MKAGQIGRVHGNFDEIKTTEFPLTRAEKGVDLRSSLEVTDEMQNATGDTIVVGTAAEEMLDERSSATIETDGSIRTEAGELDTVTDTTEFVCLPGEFVIVESSSKEFAFDLLSRATESAIQPVNFDLDTFADHFDDAMFWMSGFYGHKGQANTGVAYGDNVLEDDDLGRVVEDSHKNQLGMEFEYDGDTVKIRITENGYVDVYQPDEYGTLSFVRMVNELLMKYQDESGGD